MIPCFNIALGLIAAACVGALVACESEPLQKPQEPMVIGGGGSGGEGGCEPTTCQAKGIDCGLIDDGCGRTIRCGDACTGQGGAGGMGAGGDGGCGVSGQTVTVESYARRASSSGFSGTDAQYLDLFELACGSSDECVTPCAMRGGSTAMCQASECVDQCIPAPVWSNFGGIQVEDTALEDMTQIVLVDTNYHDILVADDFRLEIPDGAEVQGITLEVRRAGDEHVADDSVRLIKAGAIGASDRAGTATWPAEPEWVIYGGPKDLWGESWTPADLRAETFGVALSAAFTQVAGNTRAYVDQLRVTIHYSVACR